MGRVEPWLVGLLVFASCGYDSKWRSTCSNIFTQSCQHQLDCGLIFDFATCDEDTRDLYYCDETASLDELEICRDLAKNSDNCAEPIPEACFDVLCDNLIGCIRTEPCVKTAGGECAEPTTVTVTGS